MISFLTPWWLICVPIFGGIFFLIYRNKGVPNQRKVSSIALLNEFRRSPNVKALPFVPLRLLLELLFVVIIFFALAQLVIPARYLNVLVIADTSLSTFRQINERTTIFDRLKNDISQYINGFDENQKFSLLFADGSSIETDLFGWEVNERIEALKAPYADNLDTIFENQDLKNYDEIFLATDRDVNVQKTSLKIVYKKILDASLNNLFFESVHQENSAGRGFISGMIKKSTHYQEGLLPLSVQVKATDASGVKIGEGAVKLGQEESAPFKIAISTAKNVTLQISGVSFEQDAIEEDSKSILDNVVGDSKRSILVQNSDLKRLNLPSLPILQNVISEKEPSNSLVTGTIYLGAISAEKIAELSGDILINAFESTSSQTSGATEWESESPLLTYIAFDRERKFSYSSIECPDWMKIDLKVNQQPVLCHGVIDGKKVVVAGIKLVPFDKGAPTITNIVALNSFKWLFENPKTSESKLSNESLLAQPSIKIELDSSLPSFDAESKRESPLPLKWFTVIIALLLLLDSLWWGLKSRVFGR